MSGDRRERGRTDPHGEDANPGVYGAVVSMMPWRLAREIREVREDNVLLRETIDRRERRSDSIEKRLDGIEQRLDGLGDVFGTMSERQDLGESTLRTLQDLLESINTVRLSGIDQKVDRLSEDLSEATQEISRLRDGLIPSAEARWNALFERMVFELEETASLVERMLAKEPLPVALSDQTESHLAEGLSKIQPLLVEAFRGSEAEIGSRMESVLPLIEGQAPVLDLGCGRGELLLLLREAGIEAKGIESDTALVQGAVRRGLVVDDADVLEALRTLDDCSVGAVTAFHLFEHFSGAMLSEVLNQCRRVLRLGGVLVAECPNPHNLRVGASLFWQDPTHVRPLLPETLSLFLKASGFDVRDVEYLHPFPEDQRPAGEGDSHNDEHSDQRIDRLEKRLDELLHGPRDFRVVAAKV